MEQIDATESYSRRNRILDIFDDKRQMSLAALKAEYERRAGETFPFEGDLNIVKELLLGFGIQFNHKSNLFYVKRYPFRSHPKPIAHGTPYTKRSRSAPFKEDEDEDVDEIRRTLINAGTSTSSEPAQAENRSSRPTRRRDFKTNTQPYTNNNGKPRSKSEHRTPLMGKPHMFGTILIADDFFLGITTRCLNFRTDKVEGVVQSGFCVSGLTIAAAKKMVDETITDDRYKTALIYLGSIDIAENKYLVNIMQEYTEFIGVCIRKQIRPILCTLARMPNLDLIDDRLEALKGFNEFLRTNKSELPVIDVYSSLLKPNSDEYDEKYYQKCMPQMTSGCNKPILQWSIEGSKRVHDFLLKNLGFAFLCNETKVFKY